MRVASFEKAEWIDPWRDRRPMTEDPVLVTLFAHGRLIMSMGFYSKDDEEESDGITFRDEGWSAPGTVLAWMPLPEAYNPVEEEEKPFADAVTVTLYPMDKEAGYED